eukprot:GHVS01025106.1.p1 GENE.GHVS01025106.1~~GHVS01025106.1.p1  ORF type:complete len:979 (+),score=152.19 GHVS01025106.1:194-3130(+)
MKHYMQSRKIPHFMATKHQIENMADNIFHSDSTIGRLYDSLKDFADQTDYDCDRAYQVNAELGKFDEQTETMRVSVVWKVPSSVAHYVSSVLIEYAYYDDMRSRQTGIDPPMHKCGRIELLDELYSRCRRCTLQIPLANITKPQVVFFVTVGMLRCCSEEIMGVRSLPSDPISLYFTSQTEQPPAYLQQAYMYVRVSMGGRSQNMETRRAELVNIIKAEIRDIVESAIEEVQLVDAYSYHNDGWEKVVRVTFRTTLWKLAVSEIAATANDSSFSWTDHGGIGPAPTVSVYDEAETNRDIPKTESIPGDFCVVIKRHRLHRCLQGVCNRKAEQRIRELYIGGVSPPCQLKQTIQRLIEWIILELVEAPMGAHKILKPLERMDAEEELYVMYFVHLQIKNLFLATNKFIWDIHSRVAEAHFHPSSRRYHIFIDPKRSYGRSTSGGGVDVVDMVLFFDAGPTASVDMNEPTDYRAVAEEVNQILHYAGVPSFCVLYPKSQKPCRAFYVRIKGSQKETERYKAAMERPIKTQTPSGVMVVWNWFDMSDDNRAIDSFAGRYSAVSRFLRHEHMTLILTRVHEERRESQGNRDYPTNRTEVLKVLKSIDAAECFKDTVVDKGQGIIRVRYQHTTGVGSPVSTPRCRDNDDRAAPGAAVVALFERLLRRPPKADEEGRSFFFLPPSLDSWTWLSEQEKQQGKQQKSSAVDTESLMYRSLHLFGGREIVLSPKVDLNTTDEENELARESEQKQQQQNNEQEEKEEEKDNQTVLGRWKGAVPPGLDSHMLYGNLGRLEKHKAFIMKQKRKWDDEVYRMWEERLVSDEGDAVCGILAGPNLNDDNPFGDQDMTLRAVRETLRDNRFLVPGSEDSSTGLKDELDLQEEQLARASAAYYYTYTAYFGKRANNRHYPLLSFCWMIYGIELGILKRRFSRRQLASSDMLFDNIIQQYGPQMWDLSGTGEDELEEPSQIVEKSVLLQAGVEVL